LTVRYIADIHRISVASSPILRLRYLGFKDEWAVGFYKASTGQYSETGLPAASGGATGTPEQGVDETSILYAGALIQK